MSGNLTNVQRAEAGWGPDMPPWVKLLADASDRLGQKGVAKQLDKSSGYINRLIHHNYTGSYVEAEKLVRAAFGAERLMCPAYGDIALKTCIRARRRATPPRNEMHHRYDRFCPTCRNNTDTKDEED